MNNSVSGNTSFTFEYVVSIVVILVVCNSLMKNNPKMNSFVIILAGLVVGWATLFFLNRYFPYFTKFFTDLGNYFQYEVINNFTSMGYTHIWPPLLAILLVFVALLYARNLG